MRAAAIIIGLVLLVIAGIYWLVPAGSLPGFLPGFEAGSPRVHVKHGVAALVAGIVFFVIAWWLGRTRGARWD